MGKNYFIRDFPPNIQKVLTDFLFSGKYKTNRYPFEWLKMIAEENLLNTPTLKMELAAFLLSGKHNE